MMTNNCINNEVKSGVFDAANFIGIDENGFVVNLRQPAFSVSYSETDDGVTGDSTPYFFLYDRINYNEGSCYEPTTGKFTAPVSGLYTFTYQTSIGPLIFSQTIISYAYVSSGANSIRLFLKGAASIEAGEDSVSTFAGAFDFYMDAGDTCYMVLAVYGDILSVDVIGDATNYLTSFSGYLVG